VAFDAERPWAGRSRAPTATTTTGTAAICLAITVLIVGKLLTYRDRYCQSVTTYPRNS
jgi:hypothetical protein